MPTRMHKEQKQRLPRSIHGHLPNNLEHADIRGDKGEIK